jgi:hypothetical protein
MTIARHFSAILSKAFIGTMGCTVFFAMSPLLAAQTTVQPTDELRANVDSASLADAPTPTDSVLAANDLPSPPIAFFSADLEQQASQGVLVAHPQNPLRRCASILSCPDAQEIQVGIDLRDAL